MAKPTPHLIDALRATALRLESGARYEWGHMGRCNCGHLAQSLTSLTADDIHRMALTRSGDWSEQSTLYCPTSGFELDALIDLLLEAGLSPSDIGHLENLSDVRVLRRLPPEARGLERNRREHAVRYMRAWADLLAGEAGVAGAAGEQPASKDAALVASDRCRASIVTSSAPEAASVQRLSSTANDA